VRQAFSHVTVVSNYFASGACFGHQIISRSLGGEVISNPNKWEAGPTILKTTAMGKLLYGVDHIVSNVTSNHEASNDRTSTNRDSKSSIRASCQ
jgi:GMP synthase-like glutamine amidotransferase